MTSKRIIPFSAGKHFAGYALDIENPDINLLADEHEIVINTQTGHYTLINWDMRHVVTDGTFGPENQALMISLLEAWPTYVTIEKLLMASLRRGLEEINQASETERDRMILNLRCCIEECGQQLHPIGIGIQSISNLGYKLSRYQKRE
jgi:hypothetical protein